MPMTKTSSPLPRKKSPTPSFPPGTELNSAGYPTTSPKQPTWVTKTAVDGSQTVVNIKTGEPFKEHQAPPEEIETIHLTPKSAVPEIPRAVTPYPRVEPKRTPVGTWNEVSSTPAHATVSSSFDEQVLLFSKSIFDNCNSRQRSRNR